MVSELQSRGQEPQNVCTVYCVLCTVYCVLCTVYCVLCTVYCVLSMLSYFWGLKFFLLFP